MRGYKNKLGIIRKDICEIIQMYRFECIAIVCGMFLAASIYRYGDGLSLTTWSVEIWDAIFSGRLFEFGSILSENLRGAPHAMTEYDGYLLTLIPGAIWNFPIWLTHPSRVTSVSSTACVLWAKMFLIVCAFLSGFVCEQIVIRCGGNREAGKTAALFFWGSSTLMISIGNFGQDEIVYTLFLLCALYFAVADKYKCSLVWMMFAVTLNPTMILPCGLIILFYASKLHLVFLNTVALFLPIAVERLLFSTGIKDVPSYMGWFFGRSNISSGNGNISIFAVIVLLVFAIMFFYQCEDQLKKKRILIYSIAVLMTTMGIFSWMHAYRFFLCIPFIILGVFLIEESAVRTAGMVGIFVFEILRFLTACQADYCFNSKQLYTGVKQFLGISEDLYINFWDLLKMHITLPEGIEVLVVSATAACGIWLLWLIRPGCKRNVKCEYPHRLITMGYSIYPLLIVILFCSMLYHKDIMQVPIEADDILAPAITGANHLDQFYKAEHRAQKARITFRPVTWLKEYPNKEELYLELLDAETEDIIQTLQIYANQLPDNQPYTLQFNNLCLEPDKWYIFRLYLPNKVENEENYLYILRSDGGTANSEKHYAAMTECGGEKLITSYDLFSEIILF